MSARRLRIEKFSPVGEGVGRGVDYPYNKTPRGEIEFTLPKFPDRLVKSPQGVCCLLAQPKAHGTSVGIEPLDLAESFNKGQ